MRRYKPSAPFDTAFKILKCTGTDMSKGVPVKTYTLPSNSNAFFGSFRTFGGSEGIVNGVAVNFQTGTIDTWWRSDITAADRIYVVQTGETFELVAPPENIGFRRQYMQLKVQRIGGIT